MVHLFAISLLAYMSANIEEINSSVQSLTIYIRRAKTESLDNTEGLKLNGSVKETGAMLDDQPIALPVSLQAALNDPASGTSSDDGNKKVVWYWTSYVYSYAGLYQADVSQHDLNAAFIIGCIIVAISTLVSSISSPSFTGIGQNYPFFSF
jgi:hypothetical protein